MSRFGNNNRLGGFLSYLLPFAVVAGIIFYHNTAWYDMKDTEERGFALFFYIFLCVVLVLSIFLAFNFNPVRWIRSKIK